MEIKYECGCKVQSESFSHFCIMHPQSIAVETRWAQQDEWTVPILFKKCRDILSDAQHKLDILEELYNEQKSK